MEFDKAVQALAGASVEFVIIGGLSASFHGSARITFDLDVCYSRSAANLRRLAAALAPFHPRPRDFPPGLPFVWDERTLSHGNIFTLDTDVGQIDLLAEVTGLGSYDDAMRHSIEVEAYGCHVRTLDLPSLIQAKRATGRVKDQLVIPELESLLDAGEP